MAENTGQQKYEGKISEETRKLRQERLEAVKEVRSDYLIPKGAKDPAVRIRVDRIIEDNGERGEQVEFSKVRVVENDEGKVKVEEVSTQIVSLNNFYF